MVKFTRDDIDTVIVACECMLDSLRKFIEQVEKPGEIDSDEFNNWCFACTYSVDLELAIAKLKKVVVNE